MVGGNVMIMDDYSVKLAKEWFPKRFVRAIDEKFAVMGILDYSIAAFNRLMEHRVPEMWYLPVEFPRFTKAKIYIPYLAYTDQFTTFRILNQSVSD